MTRWAPSTLSWARPMPPKNEHALRDQVSRWLAAEMKAGRLWYMKVHGGRFQRAGVTDYLVCVAGRMGGVELKHPNGGGQLSPLQVREMSKMRSAGGAPSVVAQSLEEVQAFTDALRQGTAHLFDQYGAPGPEPVGEVWDCPTCHFNGFADQEDGVTLCANCGEVLDATPLVSMFPNSPGKVDARVDAVKRRRQHPWG